MLRGIFLCFETHTMSLAQNYDHGQTWQIPCSINYNKQL